MGKLDGKVAIVTGAATGIGRATAKLFAEEGAKVVIADWEREKGSQVEQEIRQAGGTALFIHTDVRQPEQVEAMVRKTVETFGRLDVIHNNAGIGGETAAVDGCPLETWNNILAVNLTGVFLGMKYAVPEMLKNGGGAIINTASINGIVGAAPTPAYCASKAGVILLTKSAALAYARQGIRVNCICPGAIATPMTENLPLDLLVSLEPIGRIGQPEEVARLVLFLASDDSSFCTGAPFLVDGGWVAV